NINAYTNKKYESVEEIKNIAHIAA
ncbi:hypothetical protein HNP82_000988, partial [Catenibacillus scindens]|nr:hypothetical protein [Catenibacillus scindens]